MRGIQIVEQDREIELGVTKVQVHLPSPLDGSREHVGTVVKVAANGNLNLSVTTREGERPVLGVTGGSIPDDGMAYWTWLPEGD